MAAMMAGRTCRAVKHRAWTVGWAISVSKVHAIL